MFVSLKLAEPTDLTVSMQNSNMGDLTKLHVSLSTGCHRLPCQ